jgi:F1F0 ATPase subunit 2
MMNSVLHLLLAFAAGAGIGGFYFGGLWWTVRRLATSERQGALTLTSFYIRTGLTLLAFYFVMGGQWERLLFALLGTSLVRALMVRRLRPAKKIISNQ